jgi:hypothetical protein
MQTNFTAVSNLIELALLLQMCDNLEKLRSLVEMEVPTEDTQMQMV